MIADAHTDLLAFLQQEDQRAINGSLLEEVEAALDSYNCAPYGDEEEGRSQVVAGDVAETIDYMQIAILDPFVSAGHVVEFEPSSEEDEQAADDATVALDYIYKRRHGYRLLRDWAKAGLLEKIGVVKACVEQKMVRKDGVISPLHLTGEEVEAELSDNPAHVDELGNQMFKVAYHVPGEVEFKDYNVPLEEFRIAPDARDLETAIYVAHVVERTVSDLVALGFPQDVVDDVEGNDPRYYMQARDDDHGQWSQGLHRTGSLRKVWLREEYVFFDLNEDGIAERLCIHRVGSTILKCEEVDLLPFEFWTPFPMPGRMIGQSLADKVMSIQRVNTVLERKLLDGVYMNGDPRTFVSEDSLGDHTIDDLLTRAPGAIIRHKGEVPTPDRPNDMSEMLLRAIEYKTGQRESRTGITRLNQGFDEDTINKTASGQAHLSAAGKQMELYVTRNFAEAVARLFMLKINQMRRYGKPFNIRVDGNYRQVDPSQWPEDMDVNVRVGLGSGRKDQRLMYRQTIGQIQGLLVTEGSPLVTPDNIYNNAVGMCRDMGLSPNDLFTDPSTPPDPNAPQRPLPPQQQAAQMDLQMKQQQLSQQGQEAEQKLQLMQAQLAAKQQEMEQKLSIMQQAHESQAAIAEQKAQMEAELAVRQQNFDLALGKRQMEMEEERHQQGLAHADAEHQARVKKLRSGGALDQ